MTGRVACALWILAACRFRFDEISVDDGGPPDRPASACAFAGGSYDRTETRSDGRIVLATGELAGTYTIPVCAWDGAARTLLVVPAAPYGKPLVTASELDYPDGNLDATAMAGLWHFDGALGPLADGAPIAEASNTSAGIVRNADATGMAHTPGVFGEAIGCDGIDDYVEVSPHDLWRGFDAATIQVWGNASYSGPSSKYMRLVSYWTTGDALGSTFQISHFPSERIALMVTDGASVEHGAGTTWGQTAGTWHHLVGVYDGSQIALYLDGVDTVERAVVTGALQDRLGALYFCQGGSSQSPPVYEFDGRLDEVAIWKRALTPAEIGALYARGAATVRAQIRTCDDVACSGESFVGPDGTAATFFSEAGRTEPALAAFDLSGVPPAPYLQVAVTLQRANAGVDPELVDVIVVP